MHFPVIEDLLKGNDVTVLTYLLICVILYEKFQRFLY